LLLTPFRGFNCLPLTFCWQAVPQANKGRYVAGAKIPAIPLKGKVVQPSKVKTEPRIISEPVPNTPKPSLLSRLQGQAKADSEWLNSEARRISLSKTEKMFALRASTFAV
jgi:hypothetical protein